MPLIAHVIDGQLEGAEEQHRLLLQAKPGSLDDATVERVVQVFTEEAEFLVIYQEQLDRWRAEPLTIAQRREVDRLSGQVARNRDLAAAILAAYPAANSGKLRPLKPYPLVLRPILLEPLYLTCAKFVTTPEYAPRLRARRSIEQTLALDAAQHGWDREVERHRCTSAHREAAGRSRPAAQRPE
jgi:hypothetical protein